MHASETADLAVKSLPEKPIKPQERPLLLDLQLGV